jgi:hydrogenase maturation protease
MKIGVVGIGNVLMGDDAVGPYIIKLLDAFFTFPAEVSLIEAGTPGLDLVSVLSGYDTVIIVDNVRAAGSPGEIRRYDSEAILKSAPAVAMTPHDPGLKEALLTMQMSDIEPGDVIVVGVIPELIDLALELSSPVKAAVPDMMDAIIRELDRLGIRPAKKDPPDEPDIWWEKQGLKGV